MAAKKGGRKKSGRKYGKAASKRVESAMKRLPRTRIVLVHAAQFANRYAERQLR